MDKLTSLNQAADKRNTLDKTAEFKKTLLDTRTLISPPTPTENLLSYAAPEPAPLTPAEQALQKALAQYYQDYTQRNEDSWVTDNELGTTWGATKQGAAAFSENIIPVLGRGTTWADDLNAAARDAKADPQMSELFDRDLAYKDQQRQIMSNKEAILRASIEGQLTPEEANERMLTVEQDTLQQMRAAQNNPGFSFTQPLTSEEAAQLDRPMAAPGPTGARMNPGAQGTTTYREYLQKTRDIRERSQGRADFWEEQAPKNIRNPLNMQVVANYEVPKLLEETGAGERFAAAGQAFDKEDYTTTAKELFAGIVAMGPATLGVAATNPGTVAETLAGDVLPEVIASFGPGGKVRQALSSAGYAGQIATSGVKEYEEKHGEGSLTQDEKAEIAAWSYVAGTLNYVSAGVAKRALEGVPVSPKIKGLTDQLFSRIADNKVVNSLPVRAATDIGERGANVVGAGGTEGIVEVGQTGIEENLSRLNTDFDAQKLATAGVLGAMGGAGAAVPGALNPSSAIESARQRRASRPQNDRAPEVDAVIKQAQETGDVSGLTDSKAATYAPGKATEILAKRALDESLPQEERAKYRQQAKDITKQIADEITAAEEAQKAGLEKFGDDALLDSHITQAEENLAQLEEGTEEYEKVAKQVTVFQRMKGIREAENRRLETLKQEQTLANQASELLAGTTRPKTEEVADLVSRAEAVEDTPERAEAASKVVTFAMEDPDAFDEETLGRLASSESTGFTPQQRETLKAIAATRAELNALKSAEDVHGEVLYGNPEQNFKGLTQYQKEAAQAVSDKNVAALTQNQALLSKFETSHSAKLEGLKRAVSILERAQQAGEYKRMYLYKDKAAKGGWMLTDTAPAPNWKPEDTGDYIAHGTVIGLADAYKRIEYVQKEVSAIQATQAQLQAFKSSLTESTQQPEAVSPTRSSVEETEVSSTTPPVVQKTGETYSYKNWAEDNKGKTLSVKYASSKRPFNVTVTGNTVSVMENSDGTFVEVEAVTSNGKKVTINPFTDVVGGDPIGSDRLGPGSNLVPRPAERSSAKTAPVESVDSQPEQVTAEDMAAYEDYLNQQEVSGASNPESATQTDLGSTGETQAAPSEAAQPAGEGAAVEAKETNSRRGSNNQQAGALRKAIRDAKQLQKDIAAFDSENDPDGSIESELEERSLSLFAPLEAALMSLEEEHPSEYIRQLARDTLDNLENDQEPEAIIEGATAVGKALADIENATTSLLPEEGAAQREPDAREDSNTETEASVDDQLRDLLAQTDDTVGSGVAPGFNEEANRITKPLGTAEAFYKADLLRGYFQQKGVGEKPLVTVKDFISVLQKGTDILESFLASREGPAVSKKQEDLIKRFGQFAQHVTPGIIKAVAYDRDSNPAGVVKKDGPTKGQFRDYRYRNMLRYFEGDLPENWATGIAYAAFSWATEEGSTDGINSFDQIRAILGKDKEDDLTREEIEAVKSGARRDLVELDLGRRAAETLGLRAYDNTPLNLQTQLEMSLGAQALKVLQDMGWLEEFPVPGRLFADPTPGDTEVNPEIPAEAQGRVYVGVDNHTFVRLVRDPVTKAPRDKRLQDSVEAKRDTQGVLEKLFGADPRVVWPELEPGQFDQQGIKNSDRAIPARQYEDLKKVSEHPHTLDLEMLSFLDYMDDDLLLQVFGGVDLDSETPYKMHIDEKAAQEVRNSGYKRELQYLKDMQTDLTSLPDGINTPFYFVPVVQSQQRAGLASNTINPQTSKIHRAFVRMEGWESTIDLNNPEELDGFLLAVAQGMNIKVDKKRPDIAIQELQDLMNTDLMKEAVSLLENPPKGKKMDRDKQQVIIEALKDKAGAHSLLALKEWVRHLNHDGPFTTRLYFETDGLTNGPAFAHILLGAINPQLGERFGFYQEGSAREDFISWKEDKGNLDLYEQLMSGAMAAIRNLVYQQNGELTPQFRTIYRFAGELVTPEGIVKGAGRNLAKPAVTPTAFGASVDKVMANTAAEFVGTLSKKITNIANDPEIADPVLVIQAAVNAWNRDILGGQNPLRVPQTMEQALQLSMTPGQRKTATATFEATVGRGVRAALEGQFKTFFDARSKLNQGANQLYSFYADIRDQLRTKRINELMESGRLPYTIGKEGRKIPLLDLSPIDEQLLDRELKGITPIMHTAMSQGGTVNAGLSLYKTEQHLATKGDTRTSIEMNYLEAGKKKHKASRGFVKSLAGPGVATVPVGTHSFDSSVGTGMYSKFPALNVHDGFPVGIKHMVESAKELNKVTYENLVNYSMPLEVLRAYDRAIAAVEKFQKRHPDIAIPLDDFQIQRENFAEFAFAAEENKLRYLSGIGSVHQYVSPGGQYTVTGADRAKAEKKLLSLHKEREERAVNQAKADSYRQRLASREAKENRMDTAWGPIGVPTHPSDETWVRAFEKNPNTKAKNLFAMLERKIKADAPSVRMARFQLQLLNQIKATIDPDMPVNYITRNSPDPETGLNVKSARGWYRLDNNTLGIKSPDFVHSSVTTETLLHELTHAALAGKIESNPNHPAVEELKKLLNGAREYVNDPDNKITGYAPALKDVHELVSWGMTNLGFQQDVLEKISFPSENRGLINGLKQFVDALTKLLFGKRNPVEENGMAALVINTALLFEQGSEVSPSSRKRVFYQEGAEIENWTARQTFDALAAGPNADLGVDYTNHLRETLDTVVGAVYGPYGAIPAFALAEATAKPEDTLLNAMANEEMPFASSAHAHLKLTNQEAFVLESVEVTMREAINRSQVTREELRSLFTQVRKKLNKDGRDFHNGDWATATPVERDHAKAVYDFVFATKTNQDGTSDYLAQFAALGLAYQPLHNLLKGIKTSQVGRESDTLLAKLKELYEKAMELITRKLTNTRNGETGDRRLKALVKNMARLEAKNKAILQSRKDRKDTIIDRGNDFMAASIRKGTQKFADSGLVNWAKSYDEKDTRPGTNLITLPGRITRTAIRAAGVAAAISSGDSANKVLDSLKSTRDRNFQEPMGFSAKLVDEMRGAKEDIKHFFELLWATKRHEQNRKHVIDDHIRIVKQWFLPMTKDESSAVTRGVLRTDLPSLMAKYGVEGLESLMAAGKPLEQAIADLERELTGPLRDEYIVKSRALGYKMATGVTTLDTLDHNAFTIAYFDSAGWRAPLSDKKAAADMKAAEKIIDQLASLYAIRYLPDTIRKDALEVIKRENRRGDRNGFEFLLNLHAQMKKEALENNFDGDPTQMRKGYVKEIFNPHVQVIAATPEEGRLYEAAGYSEGVPLAKDPSDPDKNEKRLYAIRGLGMDPRVTGFLSNTGERARGTSVHSGLTSVTFDGVHRKNWRTTQQITGENLGRRQKAGWNAATFDPTKVKQRYMAPIRNTKGQIVNYAYEMEDTTKDDLLERDNRLDQVIGMMAGNAYDKAHSKAINRNAIDALFAQYKTDLGGNTEGYLDISEDSPDPEMRELYRLLPEDTKRYIKDVWGRNGMRVRNDVFDLAFGYPKFSSANWLFDNDGKDIGATKEILLKFMVWALNLGSKIPAEDMSQAQAIRELRAKLRLKAGENIWQEIIRAVKDNFVIKSVFTLAGNIISNTWLLWLQGVPVTDMVRDHVVALKGLTEYDRDRKRLADLQRLVDTGMAGNDLAEIGREIAELQDAIRRNPVAPLIDAGLYQTIVEDVEQDTDPYSYKSRLVQGIENKTAKVPEGVKRAAKTVLMTQDTPLYKVLNSATTRSDFVARYVLYQHLTNRARKPLGSKEALHVVSESFVNYDIPTHRKLQYLNDMGLIMFSKYYLRIQKVLFRVMSEQPARMLAMSMTANMFPGIPTFLDSGFWNRADNPFSSGILEYPGSVGEIATIKAMMSPFN